MPFSSTQNCPSPPFFASPKLAMDVTPSAPQITALIL
jgi:hypothetical protein